MKHLHHTSDYRGTKDFKIRMRQPGSAVWTTYFSGTLPDPTGKYPVPMETFTMAPVLVEEVEFECVTRWYSWCALNYIGFP